MVKDLDNRPYHMVYRIVQPLSDDLFRFQIRKPIGVNIYRIPTSGQLAPRFVIRAFTQLSSLIHIPYSFSDP